MTVRRWGGGATVAVMVLAMISAEEKPPAEQPQWSRPESTVVVHGREKSFGALGPALASGQEQAIAPVNGWAFPPGSRPGRTVVAADGTVLMACTGLTIGAYDPHTNTFTAIQLPATAWPHETKPAVTDLLVLSAQAVAFTVEQAGGSPVFGVLTKVNGVWQAMPGNMFTSAQLGTEGLQGLVRLPASGDLLLVAAGISVLRLSGPDSAGHYLPEITAQYTYPLPHLRFAASAADPTGVAGDERFVMGLGDPADDKRAKVLQEFRYDQHSGSLQPVSAPLLPGLIDKDSGRAYGFDRAVYDGAGNLWATTGDGFRSGKLAVYTRAGSGRRTGAAACGYHPSKAMDKYVTKEPGGRTVWGQSCHADYELLQAKDLGASSGLVADPATGTVVSVLENGQVMAFRAQGSGAQLSFTVGNLLDIGRKVLPIARGDFLEHQIGAIDARQRLWFPVIHTSPRIAPGPLDQWLISVDLADLFDPKPVRLPVAPGQTVIVQAERSMTVGTQARKSPTGGIEIDSLAYVGVCSVSPSLLGCGYDQAAGDGFVISDDLGLGHLGGELTYRVEVARSGAYKLSFQAGTFPVITNAVIEVTILDQVVRTPVSSEGGFRAFQSEQDIELPAGTHLLTLSAPPGGKGWFLNSFSFRRL